MATEKDAHTGAAPMAKKLRSVSNLLSNCCTLGSSRSSLSSCWISNVRTHTSATSTHALATPREPENRSNTPRQRSRASSKLSKLLLQRNWLLGSCNSRARASLQTPVR